MSKVLVIGGRGYFGQLLIDDLLRNTNSELVVASRQALHSDRFETVVADLWNPDSLERALIGVAIAICAAGPYQKLPTTLAELCLNRGVHYIDLADDRGFVHKVRSVTADYKNGAAVCTGWSTVSALSGLLAGIASKGLTAINSIHIQMAPGNRGARHTATIASLMHSVGQSFIICRDGKSQRVVGWSEPREFVFPSPVGKRQGYLVDVPDHEIFPRLFDARTVEFRASSELQILNRFLSLLQRTGRNWVSSSGLLQRAAGLVSWIGHDWGAIGVEVAGHVVRKACIVADSRGERIAVMPASVMVAALLSGVRQAGLVSYTAWLTEEQLRRECEKRDFRLFVEASS
jgi:saccharopine dehydrogenase-like NADP-dependent oxidoreductase